MSSQIQVNPCGTKMWRLDAGGYCVIAVRTVGGDGKTDGINLKGQNGPGKASDVWIDVEEAKSLRDWLNTLLNDA